MSNRILILDNIFPITLSRWRVEEFTYLLNRKDVECDVGLRNWNPFFGSLSTESWRQLYNDYKDRIENLHLFITDPKWKHIDTNPWLHCQYEEDIVNYGALLTNQSIRPKISDYKLIYCLFYTNLEAYWSIIQNYQIPCIFKFYSGDGFDVLHYEKLKTMCSNHLMKKVIITQSHLLQIVINHKLIPLEKIEFIMGVPMLEPSPTTICLPSSNIINVAFMSAGGLNIRKGLDIFLDVAKNLQQDSTFQFHIVGGCIDYNIDFLNMKNVTSHGYIGDKEKLKIFFSKMNLMVLPTKKCPPHIDGFPLGTAIDAALHGVAVMMTDPDNVNSSFKHGPLFKDGEEVFILKEPTSREILRQLTLIKNDPQLLYKVGNTGRERFKETYNEKIQLDSIALLLKDHLNTNYDPIRKDIKTLMDSVITDFGGGCPEQKGWKLAEWIIRNNFKNCLEIGVYRGRSAISQAYATKITKGKLYLIDPWKSNDYDFHDLKNEPRLSSLENPEHFINTWVNTTDWDQVYLGVLNLLVENNWGHVSVYRGLSKDVRNGLEFLNGKLDMLHIDGSHDTDQVLIDMKLYVPMVKKGGYVVMDDTDFVSVSKTLVTLEKELNCHFISDWTVSGEGYTVFIKQ